MQTTAMRTATTDLASLLPVDVPLGSLGVLIGDLVGLLQQCFPDPTPDATKLLAAVQEPPYGLIGLRQLLWKRQIRNAVAQCWRGPASQLPLVQAAVVSRLRQGVPVSMLTKLLSERR